MGIPVVSPIHSSTSVTLAYPCGWSGTSQPPMETKEATPTCRYFPSPCCRLSGPPESPLQTPMISSPSDPVSTSMQMWVASMGRIG